MAVLSVAVNKIDFESAGALMMVLFGGFSSDACENEGKASTSVSSCKF